MEKRQWIDVREFAEYAGGAIEGSELVPLGTLEQASSSWDKQDSLMLICKSGKRAAKAQAQLIAQGFVNVSVLEGGVDGWIASGKPVVKAARRPWSLERQVRVGAGSMVVISLLLALSISPLFFLWTGFVGAGLVFAGVTDICMMARLLSLLPWNRPERNIA
ncbi:rhodanese-like domain-containing protein [soil metagenome]